MKKKKLFTEQNANFAAALRAVLHNNFRRVSDIYADEKTGKYDCNIYRISDTIVRVDLKKQPKNKLQEREEI